MQEGLMQEGLLLPAYLPTSPLNPLKTQQLLLPSTEKTVITQEAGLGWPEDIQVFPLEAIVACLRA